MQSDPSVLDVGIDPVKHDRLKEPTTVGSYWFRTSVGQRLPFPLTVDTGMLNSYPETV